MRLHTRLAVILSALATLSGTSFATNTDGSVVATVPEGGADGNYLLLKLKDGTQDTIYPYIDGGAHCMRLNLAKKYTGDFEMIGSISCKFYNSNDCPKVGIASTWLESGSKTKVDFELKAFACKLPMASYNVLPVPYELYV